MLELRTGNQIRGPNANTHVDNEIHSPSATMLGLSVDNKIYSTCAITLVEDRVHSQSANMIDHRVDNQIQHPNTIIPGHKVDNNSTTSTTTKQVTVDLASSVQGGTNINRSINRRVNG